MTVARMAQRTDSATNWANANPVLLLGEIGVETPATPGDTPRFKIGDGQTQWNGLEYAHAKSNYELWLDAGNSGELADFLASQTGPAGNGIPVVVYNSSTNTWPPRPVSAGPVNWLSVMPGDEAAPAPSQAVTGDLWDRWRV